MDNPSALAFLVPITVAQTNEVYALPNPNTLAGMTALTLIFQFLGGTGGSSVSAVMQTRLGSSPWLDIARADFTTTPDTKRFNLEGLLSVGLTDYAALGSPGVNDGLLGDDLQLVVTSVGTYSNTQLNVFAQPR